MATRLGIAQVSQDEVKNGLGLSSAHVTTSGDLRLDPEFAVAGGPFSLRAQAVALEIVRLLSSLAVSFVVETSVVSDELLEALRAGAARVLVVHVVAREAVIGDRLKARAAGGSLVARQLVAQFDRGELDPSIFKPSPRVGTVLQLDTSDHSEPNIGPIEAAVRTMLR